MSGGSPGLVGEVDFPGFWTPGGADRVCVTVPPKADVLSPSYGLLWPHAASPPVLEKFTFQSQSSRPIICGSRCERSGDQAKRGFKQPGEAGAEIRPKGPQSPLSPI